MTLQRDLAVDLAERHPDEAAAALEALPAAEAADFVASLGLELAARVLQRTTAHPAAVLLAQLPAERAGEIVERLPVDTAAGYLRRLEPAPRDAILAAVAPPRARALRSLLRFREGTAGAVMDPDVLALPRDLSVAEALDRVRASARNARYNLYVVDRDDRLVGVLNMRELLVADADQNLESIMHEDVLRVPASADWRALVSHEGWREVHALPIVDETGTYLGAVRYRTLRRLEAQRQGPETPGTATAHALGDLFQAGLSGVVEALASSALPSNGRRIRGDGS